MSINRHQVLGLIFFNLGVFFATAAYLPRAGSYGYSDIITKFINARQHWDIALAATLGSGLVSSGVLLLRCDGRRSHCE